MVQWTGSKVAHKEFAGIKHRIVNSLRCNITSKARGRHYTTSRGSRCVSQQGWAHDVRSASFSPLGPRSTSLPWSAAHSIAVVIGPTGTHTWCQKATKCGAVVVSPSWVVQVEC